MNATAERRPSCASAVGVGHCTPAALVIHGATNRRRAVIRDQPGRLPGPQRWRTLRQVETLSDHRAQLARRRLHSKINSLRGSPDLIVQGDHQYARNGSRAQLAGDRTHAPGTAPPARRSACPRQSCRCDGADTSACELADCLAFQRSNSLPLGRGRLTGLGLLRLGEPALQTRARRRWNRTGASEAADRDPAAWRFSAVSCRDAWRRARSPSDLKPAITLLMINSPSPSRPVRRANGPVRPPATHRHAPRASGQPHRPLRSPNASPLAGAWPRSWSCHAYATP